MKKTILAFLAAFTVAATSVAQTGNNLPPLGMTHSLKELKAFALEQVGSVEAGVYSETMLSSAESVTNMSASALNEDDALTKLAAFPFKFRVADYRDSIQVWGYLYNKNGTPQFYGHGYSSITLQQTPQGDQQVLGSLNIEFDLENWGGVEIPWTNMPSNLRKIYVIYRDEWGNYQWTQGLDFTGNSFFLPPSYAGNGRIVFEFGDGTQAGTTSIVYDMGTAQVVNTPLLQSGVSGAIDNYQSYKFTTATGAVVMNALGNNWGSHTSPVIKVTLTQTTQLSLMFRVIEDYSGKTIEQPTSGIYRKAGESQTTGWQHPATGPDLTLPAGVYYIMPTTTKAQFGQEPQSPWGGGGGKG